MWHYVVFILQIYELNYCVGVVKDAQSYRALPFFKINFCFLLLISDLRSH